MGVLEIILLIILLAWLGGFALLGNGLVHLLLVVFLIVLIVRAVQGRAL
jgi:hypothetical protein